MSEAIAKAATALHGEEMRVLVETDCGPRDTWRSELHWNEEDKGILARLVEKGLVERRVDPGNLPCYRPTEAGAELSAAEPDRPSAKGRLTHSGKGWDRDGLEEVSGRPRILARDPDPRNMTAVAVYPARLPHDGREIGGWVVARVTMSSRNDGSVAAVEGRPIYVGDVAGDAAGAFELHARAYGYERRNGAAERFVDEHVRSRPRFDAQIDVLAAGVRLSLAGMLRDADGGAAVLVEAARVLDAAARVAPHSGETAALRRGAAATTEAIRGGKASDADLRGCADFVEGGLRRVAGRLEGEGPTDKRVREETLSAAEFAGRIGARLKAEAAARRGDDGRGG